MVAVGAEVLEARQEAENEKRLADSRRKINNEFLSIARDREKEIEQNLRNIENELFSMIENEINDAINLEESEFAKSNKTLAEISEIRNELNSLIKDINDFMLKK